MDDKKLLSISIICSLIGLIILFYISQGIGPIKVEDITLKDVDKSVEITGRVTKISSADDLVFIDLSYNKSIPVVAFKYENTSIKEGDVITVAGKVAEYEKREELIASYIT